MNNFTESTIEETALEWLKDLGYVIVFGGDIAPENTLASLHGGMLLEVAKGQPVLTGGRRPGDAIFRGDVLIIQRVDIFSTLGSGIFQSRMLASLRGGMSLLSEVRVKEVEKQNG
jgi:hypothetical protein